MVSEDREYVERILAGESEAFESLVRKYNRMAGAIAIGILGDFHEAEDITQEAFLKAFRVLHTLRDPGKFRAWFAGLVRTKALDALRQRSPHRASQLAGDVSDSLGESGSFRMGSAVEAEQVREETRQKVIDAIRELPSEDRLVVVLKHMDGLSYKEISEITGSSVSSIESRLFRARQALRKKLDPTKT
jgi:RNA polymerase sigma-70 factor (ECF subfamily)